MGRCGGRRFDANRKIASLRSMRKKPTTPVVRQLKPKNRIARVVNKGEISVG